MATFESVKMEGAIAIDKARAVFHHAVRHLRRHLSDHESSKAFFAKLQETHHALECLSKTHREIVTNGRCVPPTDRHASEQENQGHRQVSKNDVLDNVDVFKLLNTVASQQETFLTSLKNVDEAMKKQVAAVDLSFDSIAKLERKVATIDELAANKANGSVIVSSSLSRQVAVPSDNGQTITETRTSSRSMNPIIACEPCVRQASPNLPAKSNVLPKFSGEPTPCSMVKHFELNRDCDRRAHQGATASSANGPPTTVGVPSETTKKCVQDDLTKLRGLESKDRSVIYQAIIEALQDEFEWDTQVSSMAIMRYFQEIKMLTIPRTDPSFSKVYNIVSDVLEEIRWGGP